MKWLRNKMNKKGFSLIELIVVIAILAIIAAIAIPRFAIIQANSEVKSDIATAEEICNMARLQHVENGVAVSLLTQTDTIANGDLQTSYMVVPTPQSNSAGAFTIALVGNTYQVSFTHNNGSSYTAAQLVIENTKDVIE